MTLGVIGEGKHTRLEQFPKVEDTDGGKASLVYQRGKSGLHYQHCETGYQLCKTGPWAAAGACSARRGQRFLTRPCPLAGWARLACLHQAPTLNPAEPSPLVPQLGGGAGTETDGSCCCQWYSFKGARHLPPEIGQP
jgi:hypothetical protein